MSNIVQEVKGDRVGVNVLNSGLMTVKVGSRLIHEVKGLRL